MDKGYERGSFLNLDFMEFGFNSKPDSEKAKEEEDPARKGESLRS